MGWKALNRRFARYVLSSMITMFLESAYSLVDGIFVSNRIGADALSAINVAWPILAVVTAIGTGIGCGGSVLMSMEQGAGRRESSDTIRANTILALLAAGILVTVFSQPLLRPLLLLMGCQEELLALALRYARIMMMGGIAQTLSCGLAPILRNNNRAVRAMTIMVSGLGLHISLDVVFLYGLGMGVEGAALASLTAQCFTTVACLLVLLRNREDPIRMQQFRIQPQLWGKIIREGISPFGISLTPSFLILWHNLVCLRTGSEAVVTAYALITSTVGSYRMLLIGVAEGMQPLASFAHGAKDAAAEFHIRNLSIALAYAVSAGLYLLTACTAGYYPALFGVTDPALSALCIRAVQLTAPQLLFTGMVRVSNSFFYAVGKNRYSLILIYLDPIVLTPVMLQVLVHFFGTDGIWLNADLTQMMLNVLAIWMFVRHGRSVKRREAYETYGDTGKDRAAGSACG
ncbi:MAG: MATE family efflux transporter [Lachnospiraceae bacterium]